MKSVAVFCGSKTGNDPDFILAAEQLALEIVQQGMRIVYGGGHVGLMGVIADTALKNGGEVIGVIPEKLYEKEVAHTGLTELIRVQDMHERKAKMAQLSEAFITLPGGVGTLEEITEAMTWAQIGYHNKPSAFLNTNGYFDHFIEFFHKMEKEGFLYAPFHEQAIVAHSPNILVKKVMEAVTQKA